MKERVDPEKLSRRDLVVVSLLMLVYIAGQVQPGPGDQAVLNYDWPLGREAVDAAGVREGGDASPGHSSRIWAADCKEYSRIDFCNEKPSKSLQNTLFYALVSIICGGKPLKTTNKLAGPVGKKGVLGGVYRLRNA